MLATEANQQLVRRFYEGDFVRNDPSNLERYFAPGFVDHDPPSAAMPGGIAGVRAVMATLAGAFSQRELEVHDTLAEADRVALRFTLRGVHSGPFLGRPATGAAVEVHVIAILRVEDGRLAERWGRVEIRGL